MNQYRTITQTVLKYYPNTQAIYLFGSYDTEYERPDSDLDLSILFHPIEAKKCGQLFTSGLRYALEVLTHRDVDLINLRLASTVLQKEIVMADRRIFASDLVASDEFEMLVISYYQKLNEERADIIACALADERILDI